MDSTPEARPPDEEKSEKKGRGVMPMAAACQPAGPATPAESARPTWRAEALGRAFSGGGAQGARWEEGGKDTPGRTPVHRARASRSSLLHAPLLGRSSRCINVA